MDVVTKSGEVVNISEKQVYTFPNGLLGFENFKKFLYSQPARHPACQRASLPERIYKVRARAIICWNFKKLTKKIVKILINVKYFYFHL